MRRTMMRLRALAPEDVLPYATPTSPPKYYADLQGREWPIKMCSHRYGTFRTSLSCACCGITGSVMILEWQDPYITKKQNRGHDFDSEFCKPHFNLYAVTTDGLVLMTKDHIIPRSRGGGDALSNYQTMCELCNALKGSDQVDMETIRERRTLYDEQPQLPRIKKKSPSTADLVGLIGEEHRDAFWANIQRTVGCWLWQGPAPKRGFPRFSIRRRHGVYYISFAARRRGRRSHKRSGMNAHAAAYYLTMGELPQRGIWQTVCRNRMCCNPAHMGVEPHKGQVREPGVGIEKELAAVS